MKVLGKEAIAKMVTKMKAAGKTSAEIKKKIQGFLDKKVTNTYVSRSKEAKVAAGAAAVGATAGYAAGKGKKKKEDEE
jgi:hypothetical protein